jgi:threonine dehydratase
VRLTPAMDVQGSTFGHDTRVSLKLELLQHAGSFKPRGAFNTLLSWREQPGEWLERGVAAASGGNHGAAVAYAARQMGLRARIFVPEISSPSKIAAIRHFGAEVVVGGARYVDALAACEAWCAESGSRSIHAYDAIETIAGQGTLAREWQMQVPDLDTVLIAVGGGGLIAGAAAWLKGKVKVVGVEPEGSCALHASLAAGKPVDVEVNSVAADSLGARNTGQLVFDICADHVDHVVLATDAAIVEAQARAWQDFRLASEPGGATALAALLSGAYRPRPGERVGVLMCGGNVDLAKLAAVAA